MNSIIKPVMTAFVLFVLGFLGPNLALAHTSDYWIGYNAGKADAGSSYDIGSSCDSASSWQHCADGYHDGYNSVNPSSTEGHNNGNYYGSGGSSTTSGSSHYQIGYNDGCAGRIVAGPHTADYEKGYADGQVACHNGGSTQGPSLGDKICHAYKNHLVQIVLALAPVLHMATGGTTAAILAGVGIYCAAHGG